MQYTLSLTKTIVVNVEARNADEAKDAALLLPEFKDDPDGTWANAEPVIEVIGMGPA